MHLRDGSGGQRLLIELREDRLARLSHAGRLRVEGNQRVWERARGKGELFYPAEPGVWDGKQAKGRGQAGMMNQRSPNALQIA